MNQDSFYLLDEFLSYFSGARERAPNTIKEYHYDLRLFFRFIKKYRQLVPTDTALDEIELADIDLDFIASIKLSEVYRFLSYLAQERHNGPAARARRTASLRAFFGFLTVKLRLLPSNPIAELDTPKQVKRLPRYLTVTESKALLQQAATAPEPNSARDYCILVLFLNCGLRLAELCSINLTDIQGNTLRVLGKGSKERTIYLNQLAQEALDAWLKERKAPPPPDENALFPSRNRRRLSPRAVENIVKKYLSKAALDPNRFSAHKLRHTAATLLYQHGKVDLRSLQQILGHESVATTEIYTHINKQMLQESVESNPLNQDLHEYKRKE